MNISVETLKKSQVKITVELTLEQTTKYLEKAAKEVSGMVKIPGFRPGQAPLEILKKHVKEGVIESHMIDSALPITYSEAVKKEKVEVISKPHIKIVSDVPLKYEATVAVYPEVKVNGYDKINIKPEKIKVEDKDVEAVIKDIQKQRAVYKKVDRIAKKGDRVEIDFEGFDEGGASLENTKSKHHPLILGEGTMVPGFEDNIEGLKKGDEKEFTVSFPKEYFHKPFQGKKVKFKVNVHEVEEIELPELTSEFLKQVTGEEKTLEDTQKMIRENLEHEKKHNDKTRMENEFLDKLADMTKVEIPEVLVEEEIDGIMEEFKNEMSQKGITMPDYLAQAKKTIADLREQRRKEAEKRLKLRFGLQELFKKEKIEVTEDDLKKELETMLALYPETERKKLKEEYKEGSYLRTRMENKVRMEKLFARFLFK